MNTIWITCGLLLIGTVSGNPTTTSTILQRSKNQSLPTTPNIKLTGKLRHSRQAFDHYNFTPSDRLLVSSSTPSSPRIGIHSNTNNNPNIYLDTNFANNFQHHQAAHPSLSPIQSSVITHQPLFDTSDGFKLISDTTKLLPEYLFSTSGEHNHYSTSSPMNSHHLVTMGIINSPNSYSTYPNKFEDEKFKRLNTRPLSSNIRSSVTRSPINYSPTYSNIKSIKHNPTFTSASLTNTGTFVPINLEQLQTNHKSPERIRAVDIEPKPSYPTTLNKPNLYLPSMESFQTIPEHLPASPYLVPNVNVSGNYQLLSNQPQLHFPTNFQAPTFYSHPFERIRTDVEVINKKRPSPVKPRPAPVPTPKDDDNSDFDESREENAFSGENIGTNKYKTIPSQQSTNFQVPSSPVFDSYDTIFGKYSTIAHSEVPKKERIIEKPEQYNPKNDKESNKPAYELQSAEASSISHENFEYGAEGESAPLERSQTDHSSDTGYNDELAHYNSYGKDFTHDFDDSYSEKLPVEEFAHIKEVPDVDESVKKEKIISKRKRGSVLSTTITMPTIEYGHKIPSKSIDQPTEATPDDKSNEMETSTKKTFNRFSLSNSKTKTTFNAPINVVQMLKQFDLNPYIHSGGIEVVKSPVLYP